MSAGNILFGAGMGINTISDISSGFMQASATKAQAKFQIEQAKLDQQRLQHQAGIELQRGQFEASSIHGAGEHLAAQQKADITANNIDVSVGSAARLPEETRMVSALDATQVRLNAWRRAQGLQIQGQQGMFAALYGQVGAKFNALNQQTAGITRGMSSMLTGAGYIANNWNAGGSVKGGPRVTSSLGRPTITNSGSPGWADQAFVSGNVG
jgi:hypothetical protein